VQRAKIQRLFLVFKIHGYFFFALIWLPASFVDSHDKESGKSADGPIVIEVFTATKTVLFLSHRSEL